MWKKKRYFKVWRCKMFGFFQKVQRTGAFLRTGGFPCSRVSKGSLNFHGSI
jgi:hypothetical protein